MRLLCCGERSAVHRRNYVSESVMDFRPHISPPRMGMDEIRSL